MITNRQQSKRLKEAGYPQTGLSAYTGDNDETYAKVDEGALLEFLKKNITLYSDEGMWVAVLRGQNIIRHPSLIECLVLAAECEHRYKTEL
jgi:hypothetical protein